MSYDPVKELVQFDVTIKANTYFAVGFGTSMVDCDMVLFQGQGAKGLVTDRWSVGYEAPRLDIVQDVAWTGSLDAGQYQISATRKLDTGDSRQDWVIPLDRQFPMIWAESTASSQLLMHTSYGSVDAILSSKGGESRVTAGP